MNNAQKNELGKIITLTAFYYDKPVSRELIDLMINDLSNLEFNSVYKAYEDYRKNPKNKFFPMPSQIIGMVNPKSDSNDLAKESASRVIEAVSKFGWSNSEEAKTYIGSVGWSAVQRFGGWGYICENLGVNLQQTTFYAQIRDLCESFINNSNLVTSSSGPMLENKKQSDGILTSNREIINNVLQLK